MITEIYLDMDGVLTNYQYWLDRNNGRSERTGKTDYGVVTAIGPSFWADMPWIGEGKDLYEMLLSYCADNHIKLGILSAVWVAEGKEGKRQWLRKNCPDISDDMIIINDKGIDKCDYAAPHRLLIDDTYENCVLYKEHDGHIVHFKGNAKETMNSIKHLVNGEINANN